MARLGDVVWIAPNEKHWHGATRVTTITHIAMQEALDGKVAEWMEKVRGRAVLEVTKTLISAASVVSFRRL
jgi:hypothetical protein